MENSAYLNFGRMFWVLTILFQINLAPLSLAQENPPPPNQGPARDSRVEDASLTHDGKGQYSHLKTFTTVMTFLGALMALVGFLSGFRVVAPLKTKVDRSRISASTRLIMSMTEATLTTAMLGLLVKERDLLEKRINKLEELKGQLSDVANPGQDVEENSENEPALSPTPESVSLPSPFRVMEIVQIMFWELFGAAPAFSQTGELTPAEGMDFKLCLTQKGEYDHECKCKRTGTCKKLDMKIFPEKFQNLASIKKTTQLFNNLASDRISVDEVNFLELYQNNKKLKGLVDSLYKTLNEKRVKAGKKPFPPLDQLARAENQKLLKTLVQKDLDYLKNARPAVPNLSNVLGKVKFSPENQRELAELLKKEEEEGEKARGAGILPDEEIKEVFQTSELEDSPGRGKGKDLDKNYKIPTVHKESHKSIWDILSNIYKKYVWPRM